MTNRALPFAVVLLASIALATSAAGAKKAKPARPAPAVAQQATTDGKPRWCKWYFGNTLEEAEAACRANLPAGATCGKTVGACNENDTAWGAIAIGLDVSTHQCSTSVWANFQARQQAVDSAVGSCIEHGNHSSTLKCDVAYTFFGFRCGFASIAGNSALEQKK